VRVRVRACASLCLFWDLWALMLPIHSSIQDTCACIGVAVCVFVRVRVRVRVRACICSGLYALHAYLGLARTVYLHRE